MRDTVRLTAAQALVRWLAVQMAEDGSRFIEGVWAIFGHGNVAGIGEAARGWLAGEIDDGAAVADMAARYLRLCRIWDTARGKKGLAA